MVTPAKVSAYEITEHGLLLSNQGVEIAWICGGDIDPSLSPGIPAPLGAEYFRTNGEKWKKTSAPDTGWQISGLGDPVVTQTLTMGANGNAPTNTWLQRMGGVPSNIAGDVILLTTAKLRAVAVSNQLTSTATFSVYSHDGNEANLTLLTTISLTAAISNFVTGLDIAVAQGKQIAARITSGSAKSVSLTMVVKGSAV